MKAARGEFACSELSVTLKETLMLKRKSILFAIAAALIAAAPACFAQAMAPYGTIGTFGPAPSLAIPSVGSQSSFGTTPEFGSGGSSIGGSTAPGTPYGTIGTFGATPGVGPAPITGSMPSISSPAGMSPRVLGAAPTSPGVIGGGPMGFCVPGSIANPC
jgi:hypothetical protein